METYDAKCEQLKELINAERQKGSVLSDEKIYDFIAEAYEIDTKLVIKYLKIVRGSDGGYGYNPESACSAFKTIGYLSLRFKINDKNIKDIIDFCEFFNYNHTYYQPIKDLLMLEELKEIKELLKRQNRVEQELKGSKVMLKSMTSKFKKSSKKTKKSTKTSKKH